MDGFVLSIDQGTTGTTVLVFDQDCRVRGRGYSEFTQHYPRPGWVEHDAEEIWRVSLGAVSDALKAAGVEARSLRAVGITNQRETVVAWERATSRPVARAVVWQDRRTARLCDELNKLTTYRSRAEEAVDLIFRTHGGTPPPCRTADVPLPGAAVEEFEAFRRDFKTRSMLQPRSTARLLKVYGARASEVLRLAQDEAELSQVISEETGTIGAEVVHAFREESAETLADCLLRRTMVGLNGSVGLDVLERAARVAQRFLGWDEGRASGEVEAYLSYVERFKPAARAPAPRG